MTSQVKVDSIVPNTAAAVTIGPATATITAGTITGITDLAVADGGTGASTAADARTNLELGTMATQAASAVAITGGTIAGITDLAVADGGTGGSDAATARTNLGAVGLTGNETVAGVKTFSSNPVVSGGGVQFPGTAVSSSDVNCLDDYEEGTWTPVISFGGDSTGITYAGGANGQLGRYTKIGRLVHLDFNVTLTSKGSGVGAIFIQGVPFTHVGTAGSRGACTWVVTTSFTTITSLLTSGTNIVLLGFLPAGVTYTQLTNTHVGNDFHIAGSLIYTSAT
jgi:hypothetical protein